MPPAFVDALCYWLHHDAWRVLSARHAARLEWASLRRQIAPEDNAATDAEWVRAVLLAPPADVVAEVRRDFARRWARLYCDATGAPLPDGAGPLLDAAGRPVHQLALPFA